MSLFSLASSCACFVESQSITFHPCLEDIVSILSSPTPVSYHQSLLRLKSTFSNVSGLKPFMAVVFFFLEGLTM